MKYYVIILLTFVFASINPDIGWDPRLVKQSFPILKAINNERKDFDAYEIGFDYYLQDELEIYRKVNGAGFFSKNNSYGWSREYPLSNINKTNIRVDNGMFILNFATFEYFTRAGYRFLFSYPSNRKLSDLLKQGRSCYSVWSCSQESFNYYVSCIKNSPRCARTNIYYPIVIEPLLLQVSCIKDLDKIYCYGRLQMQTSDSPFT